MTGDLGTGFSEGTWEDTSAIDIGQSTVPHNRSRAATIITTRPYLARNCLALLKTKMKYKCRIIPSVSLISIPDCHRDHITAWHFL